VKRIQCQLGIKMRGLAAKEPKEPKEQKKNEREREREREK
jgi:hypothetical protein